MIMDIKQSIKNDLKTTGFTSKQVSVRAGRPHNDIRYDVIIKDLKVSLNKVKEIVEKYEYVRRDECGDILAGGNTYIFVNIDHNLLRESAYSRIDEATKIFEVNKNVECDKGIILKTLESKDLVYWPKPYCGLPEITLENEHGTIIRYAAHNPYHIAEAIVYIESQYLS